MKTVILISFLTVMQYAVAQAQKTAKATFGRYAENCIAGRGLCSFEVSDDKTVSGKTSGKKSANTFVLTIKRAGLTEAEQISIAGKRFNDFAIGEQMLFHQPENLRIDAEALQTLRIDHIYNNIISGSYPIVLTSETVEVTFSLSSSKK